MLTPKLIQKMVCHQDDIHALLTNDSGGFIQAILDCIPMPVFYKSLDGTYLGCNQAFCETLGIQKERLIGKTSYQLFPKKQADAYSHHDSLLFAAPGKQVYESDVITATGERRHVRFHKTTFNDKSGNVAGLLGIFEDFTEQKKVEEQLVRLAASDPLTGIYNRRTIESKLEHELALAEKYHRSTAVIMIDVDEFKALNDNYGHLIGDTLLKSLSTLLLNHMKQTNFVGRYGGDEFIIVLPNTNVARASEFASNLLQAIKNHDFDINCPQFRLGVSLGVTVIDQPVSIDELISMADKAMYQAKKTGKNQVSLISAENHHLPPQSNLGI